MSKERMEEIKDKIFGDIPFKANTDDLLWVFDYAKEQAERARDLDESNKSQNYIKGVLAKKLHEARAEREQYREAIEGAVEELPYVECASRSESDKIFYLRNTLGNLKRALEDDSDD